MKYCILLFTAALLISCFGTEPQKTGKEGKPMPSFSLLSLDSTTWINSKDFPIGKPTVMFYFSPYCPHCKAQTKQIVQEIDELKNIQFYFISSYSLAEVKAYANEFQLAKYPNVTTALDSASFINDYFEIPGFPYFAIYGKDKKLNKSFLGKLYISQILKAADE
ncbi:TlpA family protein disulfide reductase [Longitalea luteola]|uniref:TlpA family protein disulfide reductase n=1 Tax=Longitalea luteola TaxID=2812563 RepID=UPI001A977A86|nr:redoxin domain-containing protein [Longitalea luteola]